MFYYSWLLINISLTYCIAILSKATYIKRSVTPSRVLSRAHLFVTSIFQETPVDCLKDTTISQAVVHISRSNTHPSSFSPVRHAYTLAYRLAKYVVWITYTAYIGTVLENPRWWHSLTLHLILEVGVACCSGGRYGYDSHRSFSHDLTLSYRWDVLRWGDSDVHG